MRRHILHFIAVGMLLGLSGCLERDVEARSRLGKGREKINLPAELEEYGNYDKYRDKLFRERFFEKVLTQRADRRRIRATNEAMRDGSLMEKYSEKARRKEKAKEQL